MKQQVVAHQEIHDLAGRGGAVVDVADIGDRRQGIAGQRAQEIEHGGEGLEPGGVGADQGFDSVCEGFGGGERRLAATDVVVEMVARTAEEAPSVGGDPRCARRGRFVDAIVHRGSGQLHGALERRRLRR